MRFSLKPMNRADWCSSSGKETNRPLRCQDPMKRERILRENQDSSLLGISDGVTPVKLTAGGQTLAEAPGLSLIEKNVFKQAQTVDRQRLQAKEMTLRTSDGRWESEVCEAIGLLSENKLAFVRIRNGAIGKAPGITGSCLFPDQFLFSCNSDR